VQATDSCKKLAEEEFAGKKVIREKLELSL
jgi:hypothetical protein